MVIVSLVDLELLHVLLLLLVHEVELGRGALEHAVPVEIDEAALLRNGALDTAGELGRVLVRAPMHRWQVVDVDDDRPARHHQHQVLEHRMLGAVPERVAEPEIVFDGDGTNGGVDLEAALLEHHHAGVVDARALGENENGQVVLVLDVLLHASRDQAAVLRLAPIEPDVSGGAREGALHHAREAAVLLPDHRVAAVRRQDDDVDGARVIRHADRAGLGAVLAVVERDDGREDAREYAVQHERAVPVESPLDRRLGQQPDEECRHECVEARQYEQYQSERE